MKSRIVVYFIGLIISALGIAIIIRTTLGTGPWDTVAVGLNSTFGLTIGTWIIITQSCAILLTAMIEKKPPNIQSGLVIVVRSWFLDVWYYFVLIHITFPTAFLGDVVVFILGFILLGLGIGIYIEAKFPYSPLDHLMIAMGKKFHMSLNLARRIIEVTGMILGLIIGGPVGIGTIIIALFLGNIIQFTNHLVRKLLSNMNIILIKNKKMGV